MRTHQLEAADAPKSAVLVPVPEADWVVGGWRLDHDPVAAAGVPAHVTLVVPWVPPPQITGLVPDVAAVRIWAEGGA